MRKLSVSPELIVAAHIADPGSRSRMSISGDIDWTAVLSILTSNKVPLIGLRSDPTMADCPLLALSAYAASESEETATWASLRQEYLMVRNELLNRGVASVLFKSVGMAPSFPHTSDNLDTLVLPEHVECAREVLESLGYVELRNIEEPQKFLFRKFRGGKSISAIHLHGVVGWGVPFLDEHTPCARSRQAPDDPQVRVLSPEDALMVTIAHAFYENKSFKLLDLARIRHCLRHTGIDLAYVWDVAGERGWADGLAFSFVLCATLEERIYGSSLIPGPSLDQARARVQASARLRRQMEKTLSRDRVSFPFRFSFLFGKVLYYQKILADRRRSLTTRLADVVATLAWGIKLKLRISGQRGMLVSISGLDGSGKTAHAQALVEAFNTSEVRANRLWSRPGSSPMTAVFSAFGSRSNGERTRSDLASSLERRRRRLRNPLLRLGWLALTLGDLVGRYNLGARLARWHGRVVVYDRYLYDAIVEIESSLPDASHWSAIVQGLLIKLSPEPDLAWVLDVPGDIAAARQPDEATNPDASQQMNHQRRRYLDLAQQHRLVLLDTRFELDETTSRVVRETLRKYYRDYGTWVNALLLSNPNQLNR